MREASSNRWVFNPAYGPLYEASRHKDATRLQQRQAAARSELSAAEEQWMEASEALA